MSRWRTVIAVEVLGLDLLAGLWLCVHAPESFAAALGVVFAAFAGAIVGLAGVLGTKSAIQHLANGTGAKGAWSALTTSSKPGDPPPPTVQP